MNLLGYLQLKMATYNGMLTFPLDFPYNGIWMILLGYLQLKMVTYNGLLTFNPYMVQPIQGQYLYQVLFVKS